MEALSPLHATLSRSRVGESRGRSAISLVVLHSDPRPSEEAMAAFVDSDSHDAPHYYIAAAGTIVAIAPEARATHHSGIALWHGRRRNIDRISIGVVIEHTPGMVYTSGQQVALVSLVEQLRERYKLGDDFLVRWEPDGQGVHHRGALLGTSISPDCFFDFDAAAAQQLSQERRKLSALLDLASLGEQDAEIWTTLEQETYAIRAGGLHTEWAFHQVAIAQGLGAPLAQTANQSRYLTDGGQTYGYQPFARDTLVSPTDHWDKVAKLSDLLNGAIPGAGLGRMVLEASYLASSGSPLHADWAFHQLAVREHLGSPLSGNYRTVVDGQTLALQVFAGDTLYTLIAQPESATNWGDVRRLSQTPAGALADGLWQETYKPCGATYDSASPLQQEALRLGLGVPLTGVNALTIAGTSYQAQVFAHDTLYAGADGAVHHLADLPRLTPDRPTGDIQPVVPPVTPPVAPGAAETPWLAQHPNAPAAVRRLIDRALHMLGPERTIFDALPSNLQSLAYGAAYRDAASLYFKDIVCADLVTICLAAAGLDYAWRVTEPPGTAYNSPHAANYYRASASNGKLRQLDDNDPTWLPGDILIYWYEGTPATKQASHVNLYIGPFEYQNRTYEIVEASINLRNNGAIQGLTNNPQRKVNCWDQHYFTMARWLFRMRLVELEQAYRSVGIL